MFNVSEILYGTLDALAKVYGLKVVIKICQQFIIDSIQELDNQPASNAAAPATAKNWKVPLDKWNVPLCRNLTLFIIIY